MIKDIYEDRTLKILISLYYWIEESCYNDDTIKAILSRIQCEINKQRNFIKGAKNGKL